MHFTWNTSFNDLNRIEANYAPQHPEVPAHDHDFMEIVVVVAGAARHHTVFGEHQIGRGDAFLMRPGAWHAYRDCRDLALYNCCFDPGILGRELGWMIDDPNLGRLLWSLPLSPAQHGLVALHLPDSELPPCREILDKLCTLTPTPIISYRADRVGLLVQLLGGLSRQLPGNAAPSEFARPHPAILAALKLMDNDPTQEWSLKTLEARVQSPPRYLSRMFATVAGLPPMAYLRRRRLELATTLLANSKHPVNAIGGLVGWPDANYFTRRFRAEFGLSPSAYRARFLKTRAAAKRGTPDRDPAGKTA